MAGVESGETELEQIAALWRKAHRVIVFTGAGMSTESGLPDFRSAGGLWRQQRRFEELASIDALYRFPTEFDEFYRWRIEQLHQFAPHAGHGVLAEFEAAGRIRAVITQNVDGFHERAGSRRVLCLHGSLRQVRCQRCGSKAEAQTFLSADGSSCKACGGKMRPGVVLFGEGLDEELLAEAFTESKASDLFIVLGSSLVVSPANRLPDAALRGGAELVIVNQESTPLSARATVELRAAIGPTLATLRERVLG